MTLDNHSTVTLDDASWDQIDRLLHEKTNLTGNPTPATIAAFIAQQVQTDRYAIGFCGLPGAGKSKVIDMAADLIDCETISMGDAIRREFVRLELGEDPDDYDGVAVTSDALGEFAAGWRDGDPEGIPQAVTDLAAESDATYFLIDGVRSPTDYEVLRSFFTDFTLVQVTAPFYTRLDRLVERGREGEAKFTPTDLAERDERELHDLGFGALLDYEDEWATDFLPDGDIEYDYGPVDFRVPNDGEIGMLETNVHILLEEVESFPNPDVSVTRP